MQHILLGIDPSPLAAPPYAPAFSGERTLKAGQIGLNTESAILCAPPGIGGHVGSDITAGLLALGIPGPDPDESLLFLDIGTNGEIALSAKGRLLVCSTAAGPAFEGASLRMGMRAEAGAIEEVEIGEGGVRVKTIGGGAAAGLCGSGAIDAAAKLLAAGIADETGRICGQAELREAGAPESLYARIREDGNGRAFLLSGAPGSEVFICQQDIREIQLAKAAIASGVKALLSEAGTPAGSLSKTLVAGNFGSGINIRSVCGIGLFPGVDPDRIACVGNAAGDGASLMLLFPEKLAEAGRIAAAAEHVALADLPGFQELYIGEMNF
jgi:uncharacterized 2Fe-2S/4Fe-4S cluster protein (DUF4445 family)